MRLWAKDLLVSAGDDARTACGSTQLCSGLECGVEGGLHTVRETWEDEGWVGDRGRSVDDPYETFVSKMEADGKAEDEIWESLPECNSEGAALFDARNGFNELHRYCMLWQVRHRWAKGSRMAFNCYRHFQTVIVRRGEGRSAHILYGEEGLAQGYPLAMALYGIALLPLAEKLKEALPDAIVPWFADDAAAVGNAVDCASVLDFLMAKGPTYGYYPEPKKTIYIGKLEDESGAKAAFLSHGHRVEFTQGHRYLGGFIGGEPEKEEWVRAKVEKWADGVKILSSIAKRYPQTAYAGLTIWLQAEWQYVARTVPGINHIFEPVEQAIRRYFIPALLGVEVVDAELRTLLAGGLKQGGLGIRNAVDSANALYEASKKACSELVECMLSDKKLNLAVHRQTVRSASVHARKDRVMLEDGFAERRAERIGLREKWRLKRAKTAGIWLAVVPSRLNGTELTAEEFRDNLGLRYNLAPLFIPDKCDGCGAAMNVEHALSCKVGRLVHIRHDDVADEFGYLCGLALKPSRVSHEPVINSSGSASGPGSETQTANASTPQVQRPHRGTRVNLDDIQTAADEREDQTHSPYVAGNENRGDIAVDGFWRTFPPRDCRKTTLFLPFKLKCYFKKI